MAVNPGILRKADTRKGYLRSSTCHEENATIGKLAELILLKGGRPLAIQSATQQKREAAIEAGNLEG